MNTQPTCGKCGQEMTRDNAKLRPELFLHDACLPDELKPQRDWRIGLATTAKYRTHPLFGEGTGRIVATHADGYHGLSDRDGVLEIEWGGVRILAKADDWKTA